MKAKFLTVLAMVASVTSLSTTVQAQPSASNSSTERFTLSGDSLAGINSRTAENDYAQFFSGNNNRNVVRNNNLGTVSDSSSGGLQVSEDLELLINQRLGLPDNPVLNPRPEQQFEGLDRLEVQLQLNQ